MKKNEILKAYEVRTKSTIEIVKIFVNVKKALKMFKAQKNENRRQVDVVKSQQKKFLSNFFRVRTSLKIAQQ